MLKTPFFKRFVNASRLLKDVIASGLPTIRTLSHSGPPPRL
jgi:hypothetical protein